MGLRWVGMVWEDRTSRLTSKWTPRGLRREHYRGDLREYFEESKVVVLV